ncbi:Eco57I restriction-modification methylase domain-containing protein [Priestia megaterium]|uniref:Eco57I restriction-modification methylase domain-containing protein n=1 Tax=Priestia megaterium TaxID=1404 RepID=UPI0035DDC27D
MTDHKARVESLLISLSTSDQERIKTVSDFLGYSLIRNPVNPDSPWLMFEHPNFDMNDQAVVAAIADNELNSETTIRELRQRFLLVQDLQREISASYRIEICMFVGMQRIVLFKALSDNRDDRLDLSLDSISRVGIYAKYFIEKLSAEHIEIEEDALGLGFEVKGLDRLFERELSTRFNYVVQLYRKKIAEAIVSKEELRLLLIDLVSSDVKELIQQDMLERMVEQESFKTAVGCVVDTIVLRQLLRRFLEAYHGVDQFNSNYDLRSLGLGIGKGTLEDVLNHLVDIYFKDVDDETLKKIIQKDTKTFQLELDLFNADEEQITSSISFKRPEEELMDFYDHMRRQFELTYGGDLFSGSVSQVVNQIEDKLNVYYPQLIPKLWADTSTQHYNFRYEDLSPKFLQNQYEQSMSQTIQIKWNEAGTPVVFYGKDMQEQKTKGAYYTDDQLVQYMVNKSLGEIFNERLNLLKNSVVEEDINTTKKLIKELLDIKIVDITCGGGSFLRGAFQYLSKVHDRIVQILKKCPEDTLLEFPMFLEGSDAQAQWEKYVLINMIYGIDIDYKALIIASQTLVLSALRNWKQGENFPQLIGLTLIHQNALISPISYKERKSVFASYKKDIAQLIELRNAVRNGEQEALVKAELLRLKLQRAFNDHKRDLVGRYAETFNIEVLEINIPEVFFDSKGNWKESGFDVSIGNPPWESWAIKDDEFFPTYIEDYKKAKGKTEKNKLEQDLFRKHPHLMDLYQNKKSYYAALDSVFRSEEHYPYRNVRIEGKKVPADIDLYQVSFERASQLLAINGRASILTPGNIGTDKPSSGLRKFLLEEAQLEEVLGFQNSLLIFKGVGKKQKFNIMSYLKRKPDLTHTFNAFFYREKLEDMYSERLKFNYPLELIHKVAPDTFSFLEIKDEKELEILWKLHDHPNLNDVENGWGLSLRRELHMSDDKHLFSNRPTESPLYKGENIDQYKLVNSSFEFYIQDFEKALSLMLQKETTRLKRLKAPESKTPRWHGDSYRIAYRKIARGTDKRTLIASLVPPNIFLAESIYYASPFYYDRLNEQYRESYSLDDSLVILAFLNSFVLDYVLRRKLDKNVSVFIMNQLRIPKLLSTSNEYKFLCNRVALLLSLNDESYPFLYENYLDKKRPISSVEDILLVRAQVEAAVGKLYNLERNELILILSSFPMVDMELKQAVIEQFDILQEKGEFI